MTQDQGPVVGTSFYLGIPSCTEASAYDCVSMAADLGIRHFFTSLQMPEADIPSSLGDFRAIGKLTREMDLEVQADVHPIVFKRIGGSIQDLSPFQELGVSGLRLDAGFKDEELPVLLAEVKKSGMTMVLNASPVTDASLERLRTLGVPLDEAIACHNYYPRVETGLSRAFVAEQARRLHAWGCTVMGFVASQHHHRFMTYEGLPTLEAHRYREVGAAAQELLALAWCDQVYIGDQTEDKDELRSLLQATDEPCLVLRVRLNPAAGPAETGIALNGIHTHLPQDFEVVHRARGERQKATLPIILPQQQALPRRRGTVTVDNVLYPRFAGELQIAKTDLQPDSRTNVVGWVLDDDLPLLNYLGPRSRFRFQPVGE